MQLTKQMRNSGSQIAVAMAICVCVASAAHAGTAFDAAAQVLAHDTSHARSAPPVKQLPTTRQAAALSMHRLQAVAIASPRQNASGGKSAPDVGPTEREGKTAFSTQWQNGTQIARVARNYKHDGVPLVHLWGTGKSLLAIGVSPRGVPGIYFTHEVAE